MTWNNIRNLGNPISILEEGVVLVPSVGSINFAGAGVTGSAIGAAVTETIPGVAGTVVQAEVPTGLINDSNKDFVLAHTPLTDTLKVYLNGARQKSTDDYSLATATITFVVAPPTGSTLICDYNF